MQFKPYQRFKKSKRLRFACEVVTKTGVRWEQPEEWGGNVRFLMTFKYKSRRFIYGARCLV